VQKGQAIGRLPVQHTTITSIAFHPDGALLVTGAKDHTIRLWDVEKLTGNRMAQEVAPAGAPLLHTFRGHTNSVESVRFSPDGQIVASGAADGTIRLWDLVTGDCLQILQADGPYAGMNISGVTGISQAQKIMLIHLGAVDMS